MSGSDLPARRRSRDVCPARPGAAERAMLERLEELRVLVDEYEELLRWARALGCTLPGNHGR